MEKYGEIKAILNDSSLLFSSKVPLSANDVLSVFCEIKNEKLRDVLKDGILLFPKGKIKVICNQEGEIYLGIRYKNIEREKKIIKKPGVLSGYSTILQSIYGGESTEVIENIEGPWSAKFDNTTSLGISIPDAITIGDIIGRL
ncbi:MAG: hypothetical protein A2Y12_10770 [Planctomycetes bacterium GWF2_42_9]|nr:MAG: hypothetical protein A2Y12_10770 [Planctomycetes bacterium GWF2_42_9]HAL45734.1 hypothetical protein [Phycisphaerales bacterium]